MRKKYRIGTDLGGTKIFSGMIDDDGKVVGKPAELPTNAAEPADAIAGRIIRTIELAAGKSMAGVRGIGIGSPGPLNFKDGIILSPGNLPTMHNYNLKSKVQEYFNVPVNVNNDANCFVLGESCYGEVKGAKYAFGVTLGTGFGSGIVIDGRIYSGSTDTAAEIDPSPYLDGNLEDYISGRGVVKMYRNRNSAEKTPKEIADAARKGDRQSIETWEEFGMHLGKALSYAVNLLDPEVIIIGGSLGNAYDVFSGKMIETLNNYICPIPRSRLKVVKAKLGGNAGFIGAACLMV